MAVIALLPGCNATEEPAPLPENFLPATVQTVDGRIDFSADAQNAVAQNIRGRLEQLADPKDGYASTLYRYPAAQAERLQADIAGAAIKSGWVMHNQEAYTKPGSWSFVVSKEKQVIAVGGVDLVHANSNNELLLEVARDTTKN